ncbi:KH domain-containing protein [Pyrinomonas methylaliphatogenes]|uniref:RNA-binding protein KhpA n=1 Tax=Pyrinomonas methylaliphatogenes TaxID=454194 RepID=A0A0B6WTL0_9BACT|nr:KH domain-containing protein [Pyrinomonas methylaliphatogenes]CDM64553.1 predicted RNA-binding protein (contains KH domain) [Pyrinomonas methylaliphatogenes]
MNVKDAVEMVVKALASDPEAVKVQASERDRAVTIEVQVAAQDLGRIIGRQGRTAQALRTVLQAAGEKHKRRYVLQIAG